MHPAFHDLVRAWCGCPAGIDRLLSETPEPAERAARVAALLTTLAPGAGFVACRLDCREGTVLHVQTGDGRPRPDWAAPLESELDRLATAVLTATPLSTLTAPEGLLGRVAPVAYRGRLWGFLAAGLRPNAAAESVSRVEAGLTVCAGALALALQLEEEARLRREADTELADAAGLVTVGTAASGLAHEFNNVLNSMMLQAAVLQLRVPPEFREELGVIRKQGMGAATLLKPLQQVRERRKQVYRPVDLGRGVCDVLAEPAWEPGRVQAELDDGAVIVQGTPGDLKRLVRLLLGAVLSRQPAGPVRLRVEAANGKARLVAEDDGPPVDPDGLANLFEPAAGVFSHAEEFDRLAGRSLLRQLAATLTGVNREAGGLTLVVEWGPSEVPPSQAG